MSQNRLQIDTDEPLLYRLLYEGEPRKILNEVSPKQIVALLRRIQQAPELQNFRFPQNLESLAPEVLRTFTIDVISSLNETFAYERTNPNSLPDLHQCDIGQDKVLPPDKQHWLTMTELLRALGRDNSLKDNAKTQFCLQILFKPGRTFDIDGKSYSSSELFGLFHRPGRRSTYYTNPLILPLIRQELGLFPVLPDDGIRRIPLTDMAKRVLGNKRPSHIRRVQEIADRLLQHPDAMLCPGPGSETKPVRDWVGYYHPVSRYSQGRLSTLFFAPEMEEYLAGELDALPPVPKNRHHFVSEHEILENAHCSRTPWNKRALREILGELVQHPQLEYNGEMRHGGDCIGLYRHGGRGDGRSYYVDPGLLKRYLTHNEITTRAARLKDQERNDVPHRER